MPKLTYQCPLCGKALVLLAEYKTDQSVMYHYKCGHVFATALHAPLAAALDFTSTDGTKRARHYQETGVQFIVESGYNCIIADQMRLGKTPQSLLALKNALADKTPALIIVKSANLWQWTREFKTWVTTLPNGIFPIVSGGKSWIPPGFSAYIISMDTFSGQGTCRSCTHGAGKHREGGSCTVKKCECTMFVSANDSMADKLKEIPFKCIIVDEAHSFKNSDSNRSQALVDFVKFMNTGEQSLELSFTCNRCDNTWIEKGKRTYDKRLGNQVISKGAHCPSCSTYCYIQQQTKEDTASAACGLILLTGTPILNRAEEYFVPLNLVAPERFSSLEHFRRAWLQQNSKGQWNRVHPYKVEAFRQAIAPYVLRREKEDVYTDLPAINRIFTLIEPNKDTLSAQYNKILDQMEVKLAEKANPTMWDMADDLMELRRICGMMKIMWTSDYLETCFLDNNEKYAIGIHHKSVRDILAMKLGEQNCMKLSGEDSGERKDWIMRNFETSPERALIINMLAGGVGMDFHYIDNVIVLERQWNSPTEDQFEFRFYNPDRSIKNTSTSVEYILAKGTIDEWWYDHVEETRRVFGETVANNLDLRNDNASFKALLEQTLAGRL